MRSHWKSAKQLPRTETPRKANSERLWPTRSKNIPRSEDEIDEVVQSYLMDTDQLGRLARVAYGVYRLGNKRVGISVKNGKPLVKIGGGAMIHLDLYLVNHS